MKKIIGITAAVLTAFTLAGCSATPTPTTSTTTTATAPTMSSTVVLANLQAVGDALCDNWGAAADNKFRAELAPGPETANDHEVARGSCDINQHPNWANDNGWDAGAFVDIYEFGGSSDFPASHYRDASIETADPSNHCIPIGEDYVVVSGFEDRVAELQATISQYEAKH